MTRIPTREVASAIGILLALLALKGVHAAGWSPAGPLGTFADAVVTTLSNRDLNKEAREALTAGYYEGLINEGSRVSSMNRFVTNTRRPVWEDRSQPDRRQTHDFLFYELIPNFEKPDYYDERFRYVLRTNSAGLADREYTLEKPAGTRRVALMGDSVSRGQGAPFLENYESLLEDRLNDVATHGSAAPAPVEILNFSVGSYHITQLIESAIVKATPYNPDVYVLALSDRSVYRGWHGHIATLVYEGIDLKYDFLKNMVRETGLTAKDPMGVFAARLARYRIPAFRWALGMARDHAAAQGAGLIVLMVPTADDPGMIAEEFLGVEQILRDMDIPHVNLLEAFVGVDDWARYRVADNDRHPNREGHRRLFETLYGALAADPALWRTLMGSGAVAPGAGAAADPAPAGERDRRS